MLLKILFITAHDNTLPYIEGAVSNFLDLLFIFEITKTNMLLQNDHTPIIALHSSAPKFTNILHAIGTSPIMSGYAPYC